MCITLYSLIDTSYQNTEEESTKTLTKNNQKSFHYIKEGEKRSPDLSLYQEPHQQLIGSILGSDQMEICCLVDLLICLYVISIHPHFHPTVNDHKNTQNTINVFCNCIREMGRKFSSAQWFLFFFFCNPIECHT